MSSLSELEREAEFRLCARDEIHFLTNHWYIRHPEKGRILFDLRPAQLETLNRWNSERYTICLKARQIGFSTLAGGHAVWLAIFHPDLFIVMLSKAEREAVKLLAKAKYGYKYLPQWMLDRGPKLIDNNQTKMSWDNDSAIESMPSASDPARGESVHTVIVDEWAFLPNPEEAWASIEPVTDVGGRVIGISTANGSGNFFHNLYVGATTGANDFGAIFYPWSADTSRGDDWYKSKQRSFSSTPWILHQEYPRDDIECFVKSGMSVFDIDDLERMETRPPLKRGELVPLDIEGVSRAARFVEHDAGNLQVWEMPKKDGRRYVIGADVAEGLERGDYSVAHVIDAKEGKVVAKWRGHVAPDVFGSKILWHLGWLYGGALIGVEINSLGLATGLALQGTHYSNIYYRTSLDERTRKQQKKIGWRTTTSSKPLMIAQLGQAMRLVVEHDEVGDESYHRGELVIPDPETVAELKTFVREADGKTMHGSPHDDQVISLAIANQMRAFAFTSDWHEENIDPWSLAGWEEFMDDEDDVVDNGTRFVIGARAGRAA